MSADVREHSAEYLGHLQSLYWRGLANTARLKAAGRCERCGRAADLEVHHKHYRTLGNESLGDVEALCPTCHPVADVQRSEETKRRAWKNRVTAWASKRWGEDWQERMEFSEAEERFEEWLENHS